MNWQGFYSQDRLSRPVYPTEWVVRTLAGGSYPNLQLDKSRYQGASVLDLGCGDGRNIGLLEDLGFNVSATEIDRVIVNGLQDKAHRLGSQAKFSVGTNTSLPYPAGSFDYVLACSSFYYLDRGVAVHQPMMEISRVLKPGGIFIGNIPDQDNAVLKGAQRQEDGSLEIVADPFFLRNGVRFLVADQAEDLASLLSPWFEDIRHGRFQNDYYGLRVSGFMFVCTRKTVS